MKDGAPIKGYSMTEVKRDVFPEPEPDQGMTPKSASAEAELSGAVAYTPEQLRAAKWIVALTGIGGGGPDPIGFLIASFEAMRAQRDEAQSAVTAWEQAVHSLQAHIMDRAAMGDAASPETYLRILRAEVDQIERASKQIVAARWADYERQRLSIARLEQALSAAPASPHQDTTGDEGSGQ